MRKLILALIFACFVVTVQAQEVKKEPVKTTQQKLSKNKKAEFEVKGNCEMCKKRIEKAAYSVKGVKSASWHSDHQDIHLIFDENKCSITEVKRAILNVGHDVEGEKASDDVYSKIHNCCQYRTNSTN